MDDPKAPTRADLARFITDQRTLRAFEQLFKLVPSEFNTVESRVDGLTLLLGTQQAQAEEIAAATQDLSSSVDGLSAALSFSQPNSLALDYLDFSDSPPHAERPRRVAWNGADDTLNIHHLGGVVQQVGLESYIRIINTTGSSIPNGAAVGFSGVSSGLISGAPYLANGSTPIEHFIGLATQDIPSGQVGRVTVFGVVRAIDTSAFSVGDILYASPAVAGALTATKPTAPNLAIPVAAVVVDDVSGQVLVRPILEQTKRYGQFLKTSDQSPALINTAYAITFDSASGANGVSIGTPSSRIVCQFSGLYHFEASFQLVSGSASVKNVWLWFRKNGVDIPNSALKVSLESASAVNTQHRSKQISMAAGDYIELMWAADSTNVTLDNIAATAFSPAAPAVVLSVDQIQQ